MTPTVGARRPFLSLTSREDVPPALRVARTDRDMDVSMKTMAEMVVAFDSRVADPRGPKAVCEPCPPNAPARSAAFPLCSNTTMMRNTQTTTCITVNRMITALSV